MRENERGLTDQLVRKAVCVSDTGQEEGPSVWWPGDKELCD